MKKYQRYALYLFGLMMGALLVHGTEQPKHSRPYKCLKFFDKKVGRSRIITLAVTNAAWGIYSYHNTWGMFHRDKAVACYTTLALNLMMLLNEY